MNNSLLVEIFKSIPVPVLLIRCNIADFSIVNCSASFAEQFNLSEKEIFDNSPSKVYSLMELRDEDERGIYDLLTLLSNSAKKKNLKGYTKEQLFDIQVHGQYYRIEQIPLITEEKSELNILQYWHRQIVSNSKDSGQSTINDDYRGLPLKYELVETILDNLPIGIAVNKIDTGEATFVNPQFSKIYGWSTSDFVNIESFFKKVYPEQSHRELMFTNIMSDIQSGIPERMSWDNIKVSGSDGQTRVVNAKNIPLPDHNLMISTVIDISILAKQINEIERIKINQEALINSSSDLIWSVDMDCRLITANKLFMQLFLLRTGKEVKEGDTLLDLSFGDKIVSEWNELYIRAFKGKGFKVNRESFDPVSGERIFSIVSFSPMRDKTNKQFGVACYSWDVTAETELKVKDHRYRSLVENGADAIVILDAKGKPNYISPSIKNILGYTEKEALKLNLFELLHPDDRPEFIKRIQECLENPGIPIAGLTSRSKHKDGSWRMLESTITNLLHDPDIKGFVNNFRDITYKQIIWRLLRESEEKYKLLFQSSPLPNFIYDLKSFRILDCNKIAVLHYGYTLKQMLRMSILRLYPKKESEKILSMHKGVENGSGIISFGNFWQIKRNGDLIKAEVSGYRFDYMGRACMMVIHNDITEKDRMFQHHKENEVKLLAAQKIAHVGYWQSILKTNAIYWSDELYRIWGIDKSKVKLDYDWLISSIHPDDRKAYVARRVKALKGKSNLDIRHRILLPDGSIKWVHCKGNVIRDENGEVLVFEGMVQDITDSHLALERLMISESRYRGIIESQTNFIFRTDLEGNLTYCNNKYRQEFGWLYPGVDMVGQPAMPAVMDYHYSRIFEVVEKCFKNPNTVFQVEIDKPSQIKGKIITTLWDFVCLTGSENQLTEIQCIGIDISVQTKAKNELQQAYEERNRILESIGDGFFAVDKDWIVTYWNKKAENLLGPRKQQIVNQNLWDIFSDSKNSKSYKYYHQAFESGQMVHFTDYYEATKRWFEISAYPSEAGLSVYFKDITERKIHEDQLDALNRILRKNVNDLAISNRELEQFAYVASHDLQEPLRMISSFLTQLEKKYSDKLDGKAHQYIHFAVDGAKRMRQIILDLLDFSRAGQLDQTPELVNVNEVIDEISLLLRKKIQDKSAKFRIHSLPLINAPKTAIRQIFQNLISNSLKYSIKGKNPIIDINAEEFEDYVRFSVKDNGIGISPEYFDRIFIVFQRLHNKDEYSGTGIGLALCRKLIENLGGKIWVESAEGSGSTFYFTLPNSNI